jgi:mannose-6-phosphate isomerase-like protein (cupin superfamily)
MATAALTLTDNSVDSRLERSLWFFGGLMTVHADAASTGGAFGLIETSGKTGGEPPLHVHHNEDELFYVLEGSLTVTRGSEQLTLNAGDAGFLPRNVPHTFKISSGYARWLVCFTPAGFEEYFRTIGRPAERLALDENPSRPDVERMVSVGERFGITFVK